MRGDAHAAPAGAALTVEEIQDAVRSGGAVTARGFGTHSTTPPAGAHVIDTTDLDRIVAYDPADMTVSVEAGCRVDVLAATLAEHGQWLPTDAAWPERTTVGGMMAAGLFGPLRPAFGTLRDQTIGLRWIGGDGAVLASGGKVVKNVAGYDMMKLHVGARGAFGVVTEATFKVRPRPECEATVTAQMDGPGAAAEGAIALRERLDPTWCIVVREGPSAPWRVEAGILGSAAQVDATVSLVDESWTVTPRGGDGRRAHLSGLVQGAAGLTHRISVLPTEIGECLTTLATDAAAIMVVADAASGIVTVREKSPRVTDEPDPSRSRQAAIHREIVRGIGCRR